MRWVDSSAGPVAVLQSLVPLTGVLVAVLVVVAAVTRRWSLTAATGALLAVCIAIGVPSLFGNTVAPGRDDLAVMSANLEYGGVDARSLVIAAREHRVDVLVLIEVTPSSLARLQVATARRPACRDGGGLQLVVGPPGLSPGRRDHDRRPPCGG